MRWARADVNPLVALHTMACRDRWDEAWPQITAQWCAPSGGGSRLAPRSTEAWSAPQRNSITAGAGLTT
jgi:hypothetical protein